MPTSTRGVLTLTAHRTPPSENDVQWLISERFAGVCRRQISLGNDIDTERIEASYDNGVLNMIIPLHERAKPRQIQVTHAKDSGQHVVTHGPAKPIRPNARGEEASKRHVSG